MDILVANAGLALGVASADANDMTDAKRMIDTNGAHPAARVYRSACAASMLSNTFDTRNTSA